MAQINIGEDTKVVTPTEEIVAENANTTEAANESLSNSVGAEDDEKLLPPSDKIVGLAEQELKDPNKISVTIADGDAPIVVLFGPPACGKTMTLVRLTHYLRKNGYSVTPIRTFRPTYDSNYTEICDNFDEMMNQDNAAESTGRISFMLVKVSKHGKTICQILEAPGEYYFNPKNPRSPFPRYFHTISSCRNRKIWTIMVEPDWKNTSDRLNYKDRIKLLRRYMSTKDKTIIVYNKIDKTEFLIDNSGNAHIGLARKNVKDLYPGIFEPFINHTPIARLFVPYKFDFSIFQTGEYSKANDGTYMFTPGPDVFPRRLWQLIMKRIRG